MKLQTAQACPYKAQQWSEYAFQNAPKMFKPTVVYSFIYLFRLFVQVTPRAFHRHFNNFRNHEHPRPNLQDALAKGKWAVGNDYVIPERLVRGKDGAVPGW